MEEALGLTVLSGRGKKWKRLNSPSIKVIVEEADPTRLIQK